MKENILVSIIIPMYNSEKYIEKTLQSLINQTYKNIEIIVVDDGSTDQSKKNVEAIAKTEKRIKYYFQKNSGAPIARNNGLSKANGEYVLFFDADDILLKNAIYDLTNNIIKNRTELDIVVGSYSIMDNLEKGIKTRHAKGVEYALDNTQNNDMSNKDVLLLAMFISPIPGTKLIRREFLIENKIVFKELKLAQDLNFYLQVIGHEPQIKVIKNIILLYRVSSGSISHTYDDRLLEIIKCFNYIEYQKFSLYLNNKNYYETVKYYHLALKICSVPRISDQITRKKVWNILYSYLKNVDEDLLIHELIDWKLKKRVEFASRNKKVYSSNLFTRLYLFVMKFQIKLRNRLEISSSKNITNY